MSSTRRYALALALAATAPLAACGSPSTTESTNTTTEVTTTTTGEAPNQQLPEAVPAENATTPVEAAKVEADYVGKWIGPEGLVLDVKAKPGGGVTIANQWTLDDKGDFEGTVTPDGLTFTRKGETVTAKPSTGDATGMKWLAGKKNCLTVKVGSEGYCRG